MNSEENKTEEKELTWEHNYAKESKKVEIDAALQGEMQKYGWLKIGEKDFYERQIVLKAIKDFSEKTLSDFKQSLKEKIEKESSKIESEIADIILYGSPYESDLDKLQWKLTGLQKAIDLIESIK